MSWRRQWHPTPVLLSGKSHGRRSLVGCSPWGRYKSDMTEQLHFHALEEEMATHSSVLAWRIPGMGEPGGLPSMWSHRVGHDWSDLAAAVAAAAAAAKFVIAFLPRSKCLLISWLQSPSAVILEPKKIKSVPVSIVSPSICHEVMGPDAGIHDLFPTPGPLHWLVLHLELPLALPIWDLLSSFKSQLKCHLPEYFPTHWI